MRPLPEVLLERLGDRQAVLVAGLGCSELAGLPGWRALALALAERVTDSTTRQELQDLIAAQRIATAVALLRSALTEQSVAEELTTLLATGDQAPNAIEVIARAPWRGIISTGLDACWSLALAGSPEWAGQALLAGQVGSVASGSRFFLQLLGKPSVPESLCLAPVEVGPRIVATGAAQLIAGLHTQYSFVFVGFAPDDPDLALLAGRVLGASTSRLEHFLVAPTLSDMDARRLKADYGLTSVATEGTLAETLATLADACVARNPKPSLDEAEAWLRRLGAEPADHELAPC